MPAIQDRRRWITFDAGDARVLAGKWDRICVPGSDEKDGESTEFTLETLTEMAANFEERGDPIPIDWNHQSNYAHTNGQPAPALGFYGALAVVWDGEVVKIARARDMAPCAGSLYSPPSQAMTDGIDLSRDGLWAFRSEVTSGTKKFPLGQELLPGFKFVSPTFTPEGTLRDGTEVGYCLAAVAATNTPWQGSTEITFARSGDCNTKPGGVTAMTQGDQQMAKLAKLAKFAGVGDDADDTAIKQALAAKMAGIAAKAMQDETFEYEEEAKRLEEEATKYEEEEEEDADPVVMSIRKMAASLRKMAKFEEGDEPDADDKKKLEEDEEDEEESKKKLEDEGADAKMAAMSATVDGLKARLAKFERAEAEREKVAAAAREKLFSKLADDAVAGGYPKAKRDALIKFARVDFDGARATVEGFLSTKTGAPAHLFERATEMGAPIGRGRASREQDAAPRTRTVRNAFGTFTEVDAAYADEIKRIATSAEPAVKAKVDKYIPEARRAVMFDRLSAAAKIVAAERPDLAKEAE